ncbi:PEP-CTERM sorting domain-containing protein [Terriglobus aquaticus]|uniref:PEP-CTERM sorting domain-containing protein n=1 Tax=Terriglobus aquaticus TaxID=940139 RepID=A0ABW9KNC1_9BACT|nr:PEP-CTERM sorting domain-containing protein [Terriglobus aquaticus]
MRLFALAAAVTLSLIPSLASASTIYNYTGQAYSSATTPYTTSEFVTGSFTVDTPLAANLTNGTVTPVSFSFNDGVQTITDQTAFSSSFGDLSTDANGNIIGYYIQIYNLAQGFIKLSNVGGGLSGDTVRLTVATSGSNTVAGAFQPIAASAAATPEPSGFVLLGTSALGLVGLVRRRLV